MSWPQLEAPLPKWLPQMTAGRGLSSSDCGLRGAARVSRPISAVLPRVKDGHSWRGESTTGPFLTFISTTSALYCWLEQFIKSILKEREIRLHLTKDMKPCNSDWALNPLQTFNWDHTWSQDLTRFRFVIVSSQKELTDKVVGKMWIYLEKNTLHRLSVGQLRRREAPGYGVVSFYRDW